MKNYRQRLILCCALAGLLSFTLTSLISQAQENVSLYEALIDRDIDVTIKGRSPTFVEPMVTMEIRNLTAESLYINVPLGSKLSSNQGNYCDLVVLAETSGQTIALDVNDTDPAIFQLYAYCTDLTNDSKKFPSNEAIYRPTGDYATKAINIVLENIRDAKGQETFAAQIAVWSAASGKTLTQLEEEMGADYGLYEETVTKYLGTALELSSATIDPSQLAPSTGSTRPAPIPDWGYFFLAMVGVVILSLIVFGWFLIRRPATSPGKQFRLAEEPAKAPSLELDKTCPGCGRLYRVFDTKGRGICEDPLCSTNKHRGGVSMGSMSEETEPIPVETTNRNVSRPRSQRDTPTGPTPIESSSHVVHEETEPIKQERRHHDTEPIHLEEVFSGKDKLTLKVLQGSQQGREYDLQGLEGIISRGKAGQVPIDDGKVSTPHAVLAISHPHGGKDRIRDLGSKNGTRVNGNLLTPNTWQVLNDEDRLQFGTTNMRYERNKRQLVYEVQGPGSAFDSQGSGRHPPVLLIGNNRWLITRRRVNFVDFESADAAISVPHVFLRCNNGRLTVRDISSGNGVYVQKRRINGQELIFNRETFEIGKETEIQVITNISNIPEEIGEWKRQDWIGGGGMADVYRVQHRRKGTIRAMKIPNPGKYRLNDSDGEKYRELFQRERELSRKIHHQNLVEAHEFGEIVDSGLPYLVLDYIDGPSLDRLVEKLGAISASEVAEIVAQVSQAIKCLHEQKRYVHCDVKPGNILIDFRGKAYLSDLGIATPFGEKLPGLGAPDYLPIEVKQGAPVSADTDIYSLGQTMYHMLTAQSLSKKRSVPQETGSVAVSTETPTAAISKLLQSGGSQAALARVIQKCLAHKRADRYQRVADLLQAIEPFRAGADLEALVARSGWKSSTS